MPQMLKKQINFLKKNIAKKNFKLQKHANLLQKL